MPHKAYGYFCGGVNQAERDRWLNQLLDAQCCVIHHTVSRIRFEQWPQTELDAHGQAFGAKLELRWSPAGNGFDLLVISDEPLAGLNAPPWEQIALERDSEAGNSRIFLWGTHWASLIGAEKAQAAGLDGWVQAGIQTELHYPLSASASSGAVQVSTRQYRRQGVPCLTRFVRILAAPEPGQQEVNDGS